jgi:type I restriction enzyme S subunit
MPNTAALDSKSSTAHPRYDEYGESGVNWLSKIPAHWKPTRLRFLVELSPSKNEVRDLPEDEKVSFIPMEAIRENGGLDLEQTNELEEVIDGYTYFREGDVLVAKITPCFENRKGAFASNLQNGIGFGTTELHVLRPDEGIDGRYLFYTTMSHPFRKIGESTMYGAGGQKRVSDDFIRNLEWPIPPLDEQRAIAAYLDRETERIDALIEKKEQLIDLLEEKRKSLITRVVTKGLDDDVEMQDSGVEWLGRVPAHWKVTTVKWLAETSYGLSQPPAQQEDGVPFVRATNISEGSINADGIVRIDPKDVPDEENVILREGDVLVVRSGAYTGDSALVEEEFEGGVAGYDMIVRSTDEIESNYLSYYFLSDSFKRQVQVSSSRAAQAHLNAVELGRFKVPVPGAAEQSTIAAYLNRETERIDGLISKIESGINQLREYRTALISAAVTGQIDVREATDKPVKQQYS